MIVTLRTERIRTLDDVRAFLEGSDAADVTLHDRREAYAFIERTLVRFRYHFGLSRVGKGLLRKFLAKVTGNSPAQLSRLIARQRRTGGIRDRRHGPPARPFRTLYTPADVRLLAEVDEAFGQLSGPATKEILHRQHEVFGDERFARLAPRALNSPSLPRDPVMQVKRGSQRMEETSQPWRTLSSGRRKTRRGSPRSPSRGAARCGKEGAVPLPMFGCADGSEALGRPAET